MKIIMSKKLKVYIALTLAMLLWGISFVITKQALIFYQPFTIVMFRFGLSSAILFILNFWLKRIVRIKTEDIPNFFLLAFFQPFLYFIGENYGLKYASSTAASVIISTIPLFTSLGAYIFFKEKTSFITFVGIIISILGILLVILKPDFSFTTNLNGILFLGLAVFSAVIYSLLVVKLSDNYNVYTIISWQNLIGTVLFIPAFFIFDYSEFKHTGFIIKAFIPIFELAVFASSICYIFFVYAIKNIGVTKANIYANIIPVFTAIFAFFILNEELSLINVLGIFIVLTGVILSQISAIAYIKRGIKFIARIFPKS